MRAGAMHLHENQTLKSKDLEIMFPEARLASSSPVNPIIRVSSLHLKNTCVRMYSQVLGYGPQSGDSLLLIVMYRMLFQISKHSMVYSFILRNCHVAHDVMDFQGVYSFNSTWHFRLPRASKHMCFGKGDEKQKGSGAVLNGYNKIGCKEMDDLSWPRF